MAKKINYDVYAGHKTIYHICNELINNVYNHTPIEKGYADYAYTYSQEYPSLKKLDISIMDDGVSIPGKFEEKGFDFKDDCDAIYQAISSTSTSKQIKDDPNKSRGHGLWTTLRLVVECNEGSALIVSRQGCLHIKSKNNFKYYHLQNNNIFKGTLISLKLNNNQVQNYYEQIELGPIHDYKYAEGEL